MSSDRWPEAEADPLPRRNVRPTAVFLGVVVLGLIGALMFRGGEAALAEVGEIAPDFEIDSFEGEPIVLSELVGGGRPIVVNLMASWCAPCREEIPELSAFADANPGVIVLGVAVEDVYADFRRFVTEVGPTYPVGFDEGDMRESYPSFGLPATFFLDSEGRVVEIYNGILDREILEEMVAGIS